MTVKFTANVNIKPYTNVLVEADSPGELNAGLSALTAANTVAEVGAFQATAEAQLNLGGEVVAQFNSTQPQPVQPQAAPVAQYQQPAQQFVPEQQGPPPGWAAGPVQQAPQQAAPPAQAGPPGPAPYCQHGQMNWVDPQNKPWKGWFCALPQDAPQESKCKPQFIKG